MDWADLFVGRLVDSSNLFDEVLIEFELCLVCEMHVDVLEDVAEANHERERMCFILESVIVR